MFKCYVPQLLQIGSGHVDLPDERAAARIVPISSSSIQSLLSILYRTPGIGSATGGTGGCFVRRRSFLRSTLASLSAGLTVSGVPRAETQVSSREGNRPPVLLSSQVKANIRIRSASESDNFEYHQVAEGVFSAIPKEGAPWIGSNAGIVVGDESVLVMDTHMRPSAAREVLDHLKLITPLPVRYVVNSHFHNDHTQGNQAFFNSFPKGVECVAHANTRRDIVRKAMPPVKEELKNLPAQIDEFEKKYAATPDKQEQAQLKIQLQANRAYLDELRHIDITLPTLTFDRSLYLHRSPEIRVHYFGRGHTAGDVVLLLPKERVLICGDLFLGPHIPYAADSFPSQWSKTLRDIAELDFDQVMLGHTPVVKGDQARTELGRLISFMEDVVSQVAEMVRARKSLESVKAGLDVQKYRGEFVNWKTHSGIFIERAYAEA